MAKRLFVGGLPYSTTEEELRDLFSKAGSVESINIIIDRFTNQAKGFAFVDMGTDEEAQNAIKTLNGTDLGGRKLIVAEAKPMEERPQRNFGGGGFQDRGRRDFGDRGKRQKRW